MGKAQIFQIKNVKMGTKALAKISFFIWAVTIAALSIVSYSNDNDVLASIRLTPSGLFMHYIAYFIGALLCNRAFRRNGIMFNLLSSLSVFLYGVLLELVQLYLPYRTFNPLDIAANALGIIFFVFIWIIYSHFLKRKLPTSYGGLP